MKTLELTEDACKLIADALQSQINSCVDHHNFLVMCENNDDTQKSIDENKVKIRKLRSLLYYIKNRPMITIDGREYTIVHYDVTTCLDCAFDIVSQLKPMEAQRFFDKYFYRTEDGKCCACYANDTSNNWSI